MPESRNASVAVIGAGDFIGAAIARRFAAEGYLVYAGRRTAEKLAVLKAAIAEAGGRCEGRALDARKEEDITAFLAEAEALAPLAAVIVNPGANVHFPILDTTERVFRKVWEMACYAGFLAGREAARLMLPRGEGAIFFTGATASLRGGDPDALPPDTLMNPESVADAYWRLFTQTRDAWTFELDLRPYGESW